jgi:hypothetical protein
VHRSEFAVHLLNDKGKDGARRLADLFTTVLDEIEGLVGVDGREIAIVRTKLEEASFFAKKALAMHAENQIEYVPLA